MSHARLAVIAALMSGGCTVITPILDTPRPTGGSTSGQDSGATSGTAKTPSGATVVKPGSVVGDTIDDSDSKAIAGSISSGQSTSSNNGTSGSSAGVAKIPPTDPSARSSQWIRAKWDADNGGLSLTFYKDGTVLAEISRTDSRKARRVTGNYSTTPESVTLQFPGESDITYGLSFNSDQDGMWIGKQGYTINNS